MNLEARPDQSSADAGQPPIDEIRRQLARVIESTTFRGAPRLKSFLTFAVETALAGNGKRIKAYTIAVEAFGRGGDFDPQTDPIVRVEAGRLRQALARYYAGAGRNDQLVIELPRGTYVPRFHRVAADHAAPARLNAGPNVASGSMAEIDDRTREVGRALAAFGDLVKSHWLQVTAMAAEVESARRTLLSSCARLRNRDKLACRSPLPLLPTAPPSQPDTPRMADGRQEQRDEQAQSAPAARPGRPRCNRNRRHAANDGDDSSGL